MHRTILTTAALCGLLAVACGEKPATETDTAKAPAPVVEPAADQPAPKSDGPAGEVAPDTRLPAEMKSNLPEGVDAHFAPYFEKVPFTWGIEAGLAKAEAEGKPAMLFYTAVG